MAVEVAPQVIGGASGDAVSRDEPPIQAQGGINHRLAQGPVYHGGEPPVIAHVSQDKYGIRIFDKIPQP